METYISDSKIKSFKNASGFIAILILLCIIINIVLNVEATGFYNNILGIIFNFYFPFIAIVILFLWDKELVFKWKYLFLALIVIVSIVNIFFADFFWGVEGTHNWALSYCANSTVGEFQTILCLLEFILLLFNKHLKLVDFICLFDFVLGFGGFIFFSPQGNLLFAVHYFIFHMLWATMLVFINPTKGYSDVFCYDTVFSKIFSRLLVIIIASSLVLSLAYYLLPVGIVGTEYVSQHFYYTVSISATFAVIWLFAIFYARRLNYEDIQKRMKIDNYSNTNELLLSEIHHRVKNNLNVIVSFINIQKRKMKVDESVSVLNDVQSRVMAMSLVHSNLYQFLDFDEVNLNKYVIELSENIAETYENPNVDFDFDIPNIPINIDIILPLGLIINESITNSFKYAFPDGRKGSIIIHLKELSNDSYKIIIGDNGVGCKENCLKSGKGIGNIVIKSLAAQIDAEITYDFDDGLKRIITFKNVKK